MKYKLVLTPRDQNDTCSLCYFKSIDVNCDKKAIEKLGGFSIIGECTPNDGPLYHFIRILELNTNVKTI